MLLDCHPGEGGAVTAAEKIQHLLHAGSENPRSVLEISWLDELATLLSVLDAGKMDDESATLLGKTYLDHCGEEANPAKALGLVKRLASEAEALAPLFFGGIYDAHPGWTADWFTNSTEYVCFMFALLGDPAFQFCAGGMSYENGDPETAFKWFMMAAEQGHPEAQHKVGTMLLEGKGVEADHAEGLKWLKKAAEGG